MAKKKTKTYYSQIFSVGVIFFILGAMENNIPLYSLGIVLAIIGIANKSKWANECKIDKKTAVIGFIVAFIVAVAIVFLRKTIL